MDDMDVPWRAFRRQGDNPKNYGINPNPLAPARDRRACLKLVLCRVVPVAGVLLCWFAMAWCEVRRKRGRR